MPRSHPFSYINYILDLPLLWNIIFRLLYLFASLGLLTSFQVASEMLKQGDFLLQFFRVFCESILLSNILSISASSFNVVEVVAIRIQNNLS